MLPNNMHNRVEFHVFGDGELRQKLEEQKLEKLDKGVEFHFRGFRKDIPAAIRDFHILIAVPERAGFELVLLEAMAMELVVLAYDNGPIPEVIGKNGPGILVPNGDKDALMKQLCALISEPRRIKALGTKGRKRVEEKFDLGNSMQQYAKLLG
jgi:glycosyltransferase involved in cell wall biosynthesis